MAPTHIGASKAPDSRDPGAQSALMAPALTPTACMCKEAHVPNPVHVGFKIFTSV
jgi:hypothetical protein